MKLLISSIYLSINCRLCIWKEFVVQSNAPNVTYMWFPMRLTSLNEAEYDIVCVWQCVLLSESFQMLCPSAIVFHCILCFLLCWQREVMYCNLSLVSLIVFLALFLVYVVALISNGTSGHDFLEQKDTDSSPSSTIPTAIPKQVTMV